MKGSAIEKTAVSFLIARAIVIISFTLFTNVEVHSPIQNTPFDVFGAKIGQSLKCHISYDTFDLRVMKM